MPVIRTAVLALAGSLATGCGLLEEYKTCRDVRVIVENSYQTLGPVYIQAPGESLTDFGPLDSGQTREVVLCLDRGETARFRAATQPDPNHVIGLVRCVANQASYEATSVRVVWTLQGFLCMGW